MSDNNYDIRLNTLEIEFKGITKKLDEILDSIRESNSKDDQIKERLGKIETKHTVLQNNINLVAGIFTLIIVPLTISVIPILIDHHNPDPHQHDISSGLT